MNGESEVIFQQEEKKDEGKPKNVPSALWEKFKSLEKRTNAVTQRSTEKRIKHLQKQVMDTVTKEFISPEDRDILRKYDVKFGPPVEKSGERKRKADSASSSKNPEFSNNDPIEELSKLLNVNKHLCETDHSRPPPQTALEMQIDAAIKAGDFSNAEKLSDHLADRELGEKIVSAIEAKKFIENKKIEEESAKSKKKKKLNWGFEPKQRWETKGNM